MGAEFYAEDKTLNKPYAKINFNIYFDLIDRNKGGQDRSFFVSYTVLCLAKPNFYLVF